MLVDVTKRLDSQTIKRTVITGRGGCRDSSLATVS